MNKIRFKFEVLTSKVNVGAINYDSEVKKPVIRPYDKLFRNSESSISYAWTHHAPFLFKMFL